MCRQDSTSKLLVIPLYVICVQLFASRASSRCKHDVGALSWLNAETVERAPTPFFGRLVRCSPHGPFFGRLRSLQLHVVHDYLRSADILVVVVTGVK